ncbi:hypothetical protein TNCV_440821 [Trichonephila clavipes]|nr:hypothetical protein TNCV_440821 [Trichonephila clavipes]
MNAEDLYSMTLEILSLMEKDRKDYSFRPDTAFIFCACVSERLLNGWTDLDIFCVGSSGFENALDSEFGPISSANRSRYKQALQHSRNDSMAGLWPYNDFQVMLESPAMRPKHQAESPVVSTGTPLDLQKSKEHYFYIH